jgi:hypothetical protein
MLPHRTVQCIQNRKTEVDMHMWKAEKVIIPEEEGVVTKKIPYTVDPCDLLFIWTTKTEIMTIDNGIVL